MEVQLILTSRKDGTAVDGSAYLAVALIAALFVVIMVVTEQVYTLIALWVPCAIVAAYCLFFDAPSHARRLKAWTMRRYRYLWRSF